MNPLYWLVYFGIALFGIQFGAVGALLGIFGPFGLFFLYLWVYSWFRPPRPPSQGPAHRQAPQGRTLKILNPQGSLSWTPKKKIIEKKSNEFE